VILLGLVAAVYWPVIGFEFVNWDDPWYVLKNPLIRSWHPANLWRIATEMSVKNYAPLTTLSLLVDHTLFGLQAGGYHFTNVVLHAANVVLVAALASRLTASRSLGLVTAILFAVHPVQIETVAWVSSRKTLLCSLFMLASCLCWLRTERTAQQELWGTLWLALALLAKAAAIVLPPIVLAYDLLVRRKPLAEALPRQLVPGFLCLLLLNLTMSAQTLELGGMREHLVLGKLQILAIDAIIVWKYVQLLAWPSQLSVLYDTPIRGIALQAAAALAAWTVVAIGCWRKRRDAPLAVWAVLTWFLLLAPVLNLFPITTLMNDRYLYLPCTCAFAFAAAVLVQAGRALARRRWACTLTAATVFTAVVTYSLMTARHLPVWRNDRALWEHTIGCVPRLPVAQIQWADALHASGQRADAVAVLQAALAADRADDADRMRMRQRLAEWDQ
jgi:hypothetical protein